MNKDIAGKRFNRLTAVKLHHSEKRPGGGYRYFYTFKCDCGEERVIRKDIVISSGAKSCGCLHEEWNTSGKARRKHGMTGTKFYETWSGMHARCNNKNSPSYPRYGGTGVKVYKRWRVFENFRDDMYQSFLEHVEKHGERDTSIDRIDSAGNYCKENCRWATNLIQGGNTRRIRFVVFRGQKYSMSEWDRILGFCPGRVKQRIYAGWSIKRTITTPIQ